MGARIRSGQPARDGLQTNKTHDLCKVCVAKLIEWPLAAARPARAQGPRTRAQTRASSRAETRNSSIARPLAMSASTSAAADAGPAPDADPAELTKFVENMLENMVRERECRAAAAGRRSTWRAAARRGRPADAHRIASLLRPPPPPPPPRPPPLQLRSPPLPPRDSQNARFKTMSDAILSRIDEMGVRIEELEKTISDLSAAAGPAPAAAAAPAPASS